MSEPAHTAEPPDGLDLPRSGDARAFTDAITEALKQLRLDSDISQTRLAQILDVNRSTFNGIEKGRLELTEDLAETIDAKILSGALRADGAKFAALVRMRDRAKQAPDELNRDDVIAQMLQTPNLLSVRAVVADDTPIASLILRSRRSSQTRYQLIFPSQQRETQLFTSDFFFASNDNQIKRLLKLRRDEAIDIAITESELVTFSLVIVQSPTGSECAFWPPLPARSTNPTHLPPSRSVHPQVVTSLQDHLEFLMQPAYSGQILHNEAMAVLDADFEPVFTRFVPLGEPVEWGQDEAYAVALVLLHAATVLPGLGIGHRVVLHQREEDDEDKDKWSLVANVVEESSLRKTLAPSNVERSADDQATSTEVRRSRDAITSSIEVASELGEGRHLTEEAFRAAAVRELLTLFGLRVDPARLVNQPLERELAFIPKKDAPAIVPRLFTLELDNIKDDVSELTAIRQFNSNIRLGEFGKEQFDQLSSKNDFILAALKCGYLDKLFDRLRISEK